MFHTIILAGRLGRDPEMRYTPSGDPVTNLDVAVDDGYGEKKKTLWVRVSVWGKQAEAANTYLRKGSAVLIQGRLISNEKGSPRIWSRQDGSPGASFEVNAMTVRFLGGKNDDGGSAEAEPEGETAQDEIPF